LSLQQTFFPLAGKYSAVRASGESNPTKSNLFEQVDGDLESNGMKIFEKADSVGGFV